MAYNVYNKELRRLSILDNFIQMEWREDYQDVGSLLLVIAESPHNVEVFKIGNYITNTQTNTIMIITGVTHDENKIITVFGVSALYLLSRRIVDETVFISNAEAGIRNVITKFRPFPIIVLGDYKGYNININPNFESTYVNVLDLIFEICKLSGLGVKAIINTKIRKIEVHVYRGSEQINAVYSDVWGNLLGATLAKSEVNFKNVAYVAGQGRNEERVLIKVGETESKDEERFELYVDARDLQQEENESIESYKNRLIIRGKNKLEENNKIFQLDVNIPSNDFGNRIFLGDFIRCNIDRYKLSTSIRIQGVIFKQMKNIKTTSLILGVPIIR